jgi:aerobic carbon-monoxide dehydrogenase small subunit
MSETSEISLTVNGSLQRRSVQVRMTLADFIRHELRLTGTHLGCEHGVCGACTVLIDGRSARSCLTLAVQADGCEITTVEALASNGNLNRLQEAFIEHHGLQCGFCTPGILMSLTELLADHPNPTETEVRETLTGHLCRCTGYAGMVKAALAAAKGARDPESVVREKENA